MVDSIEGYDGALKLHFTSVEGLNGIVTYNFLRLTSMAFLNDQSEIEHGKNLANDVLSAVTSDITDARQLELAQRMKDAIAVHSPHDSFCTSFTSVDNEGSEAHWDRYAAESTGCAIELDVKELVRHANFAVALTPISYVPSRQKQAILHALRAATIANEERDWEHIIRQLLSMALPMLKNPEFEGEAETRIILPSEIARHESSKIRTFYRGSVQVPYFQLRRTNKRKLPITRIIMGRRCVMTASEIRVLLMNNGFGAKVPITPQDSNDR